MRKWYIYTPLLLINLLLISPEALFGQYFLYNDAPINIDASFTRHSIESTAQKAIFNILNIKNKSNRQENLTLNITVPQGWDVIGSSKTDISLNPLDSLIIPVRVAVGAKVKGDIGYSIIASLTDIKGNTVKNVYCFVKIPRVTNISIQYIGKLSYLDPISNATEFSVVVKNRGNREEPVNMLFDGNRQLLIGTQRNLLLSNDVYIPPYTDTTFTFRTELRDEEFFGKNMFVLKSTIKTVDTTLQSTFWFRKIGSYYKNYISPTDKPLTIELIALGILDASRKPIKSAIIEGRTLFKGKNEVYYYYRNFASTTSSDLYKNTKMYLGGIMGNWNVEVGDNNRSFETVLFGRGGYLAFRKKWVKAEIIANKNEKSNLNNFGGALSFSPTITSKIFSGVAYSKSYSTIFESKLGYIGTGFSIKRKHNFYTLLGYNLLTSELNRVSNHPEYGGAFNYNSTLGKLNTLIEARYGSQLYNSSQAGRLNIFTNIQWYYNQKSKLSLYYTQNLNNRPTIQNSVLNTNFKMGNHEYKLEHMFLVSPNIYAFYGPAIEDYQWSGSQAFPANGVFSSINYKLIFGARFKNAKGTSMFTPKLEIARSNVLSNPFQEVDSTFRSNKKFNYQYFSLNYRDNSFNIIAFYTSGPRSIIEQALYSYSNKTTHRLQFMPAFDRFIYKDVVRLHAGLSYTNNLVAKSSYSNITGQVYWYLPKEWRFYVLAVYTLQSRTNPQDNVENYQSLYVEASIKKEFNLQHPRVKFYDIELIFFKDFDGNFIQGENEPGVKNVLLSISRTDYSIKASIPGDFYNTELLSDNLGRVKLEKIPEGIYKIVYNPIGKDAGSFSKALEEMTIAVDKNKVLYIPFVEKNKVFGKIVLSRSRLSGLGRIDVSNVRITATDSKGRTYTTLTDKNGEFVIFAPITDQYVVNINNIFYENFDLRQNNFKVQFNGYKQFEVNFVFDEKIRRINFSPSTQDAQLANVLQVRKTNLNGSVKDASSLLPIRARVNLINTKTNTVLTSMYSNSQTGDYNISFMADDYYLLEVLADGYWYHSENLNLNQVTTFLNVTKDVMLKPIAIGSKIELNIRFDINKTDLAPESVAELNRLLKLLKENENIKIEVQGHSDDLEALSNSQISEDRAKVVTRYLIENGFSNLQIRGFGNTMPIASNDTEQGRATNRRVEIEVVSK